MVAALRQEASPCLGHGTEMSLVKKVVLALHDLHESTAAGTWVVQLHAAHLPINACAYQAWSQGKAQPWC